VTIDLDLLPPTEPTPVRGGRRWPGAVVVVLLVAIAAVAALIHRPVRTTPEPIPLPTAGPWGWVEKLVDAPARGALAGDASFTATLLDEINRMIHGRDAVPALVGVDGVPHPDDLTPSLLFADDIAQHRVVVLALRLPSAPVPAQGRTAVAWLSGPRGATAGELVSALGSHPLPDDYAGRGYAAPFMTIEAGEQLWPNASICTPTGPCVRLGLAPPSCVVETSPASDLKQWTPEPTGSYIVRTDTSARAEYWRVSCDGVVRDQAWAPRPVDYEPSDAVAPDWLVRPALDDLARLTGDGLPALAVSYLKQSVPGVYSSFGFDAAGPPRVIWASPRQIIPDQSFGRDPSPPAPTSGWAFVLATPSVRSTWFVTFEYFTDSGAAISSPGGYEVASDPTDPAALLADQVGWRDGTILAIARSAEAVDLVGPDGTVALRATVVDGAAVLTPPDDLVTITDDYASVVPGVRIVSRDADGTVLADTPPLYATPNPYIISNWD
jgi:hypothetical protein